MRAGNESDRLDVEAPRPQSKAYQSPAIRCVVLPRNRTEDQKAGIIVQFE
jgi:hypothetical protein